MSDPNKDAAGDLLIQEVDEELRREQYAQLWQRYGNWLIAAAVGIVLVVAGHEGWQAWQRNQSAERAAQIEAAEVKAEAGDPKAAAEALAPLAAKGGEAGTIAQLRRATLLAGAGDRDGAIKAYETIAADGGAAALYRDLAVVRLALMTADQADPKALEARLQPLTANGAPWRHSALELIAALAHKQGDLPRARETWQRLADDVQAPQGIRARAAELLAATGAGAKAKG